MEKKEQIFALPYEDTLTLRDQFAMAALTGLLANSYAHPSCGNYSFEAGKEDMANTAYTYADAMLKARESNLLCQECCGTGEKSIPGSNPELEYCPACGGTGKKGDTNE